MIKKKRGEETSATMVRLFENKAGKDLPDEGLTPQELSFFNSRSHNFPEGAILKEL